jgi:hypothetical protein
MGKSHAGIFEMGMGDKFGVMSSAFGVKVTERIITIKKPLAFDKRFFSYVVFRK